MEYFKSLTQSKLIESIQSTKKALYLCLPSIHKEIAVAINQLNRSSSLTENDIKIHVLVDYDAQTIRQGYGDHLCVKELIQCRYDVKTLKDNRISFIISDDT